MIVLYTGKPGSGKTYRCVYDLLKKGITKQYYVFHNIDGLKPQKFDHPECVKSWKDHIKKNNLTVEEFFTKQYQEKICKEVKDQFLRNVLIVIDEAHVLLSKQSAQIEEWLSYHRHLGQDIKLVCQRDMQLHSCYRALVEYELRAKHGTVFNVPMLFTYRKIFGGEGCGISVIPKKKSVFRAYKSFDVKNSVKKGSYAIAAISGVVLICAVWFFLSPERIMDADADYSKEVVASYKNYSGTGGQKKQFKMSASVIPEEPKREELRVSIAHSVSVIKRDFCYRGHFNGVVVVEEVRTGVQYRLEDIAPYLMVLDTCGGEYCIVFDKSKEESYRIFKGAVKTVNDASDRGSSAYRFRDADDPET